MPHGNKKYQASIRMPESMWNEVVEASAQSSISAMEYMRRDIQKELNIDKEGNREVCLTAEQTRSLIHEQVVGLQGELNATIDERLKKIRDENSIEIKKLRGLLTEQQKTINTYLRVSPKEK